MQGTEFILRSVAALGVEHLFMFVGGLVDPFLPAVCAGIVTPIVCANEAGAGYAADGYARATGKFGAVMVIGGPGAFNAVGAVGAARADGVPLLLITGETATGAQGRGSFQDATAVGTDDIRLFDGITAASTLVPTPSALPQYLRDAIHDMLGERRSPVHLAVPMDVQRAEVGNPVWHPRTSVAAPRVLDMEAFAAMGAAVLTQGERFAILAGSGVVASDAADDLRAVAETLQIPVATTYRAQGSLAADHPLSLGLFGYAGHPPAEDCLISDDIDAVIVFGSSLNQRDTLDWNARLQPRLGLVQIDIRAALLGRNYPARHQIVGDARTALRALLDDKAPWGPSLRASAARRRAWADGFLQRPRFLDADNLTSDAVPIHPARVVGELRKALPRDAALLVDSGAHRAFAGHYFPVYHPNRLISATGLGPMGWAIAASVGVAVALPGTKVAVITGDGCMLQNGLEIQTAARHGLDILYVVINNAALGNVYLRARALGEGPRRLTELPTHDWASLAQALGVRGVRVEDPALLAPTFQSFVEGSGPMLVDIRCTRDAATPIAPWVEAQRHPDVYAE